MFSIILECSWDDEDDAEDDEDDAADGDDHQLCCGNAVQWERNVCPVDFLHFLSR